MGFKVLFINHTSCFPWSRGKLCYKGGKCIVCILHGTSMWLYGKYDLYRSI